MQQTIQHRRAPHRDDNTAVTLCRTTRYSRTSYAGANKPAVYNTGLDNTAAGCRRACRLRANEGHVVLGQGGPPGSHTDEWPTYRPGGHPGHTIGKTVKKRVLMEVLQKQIVFTWLCHQLGIYFMIILQSCSEPCLAT